MSVRDSRRLQCHKCPWKVTTDPLDIPNGYDVAKHVALESTICRDPLGSIGQPLHIMACHEAHKEPCVGWLENQIGPGNNIALRIKASTGAYGMFETVGEQHGSLEETFPDATRGEVKP